MDSMQIESEEMEEDGNLDIVNDDVHCEDLPMDTSSFILLNQDEMERFDHIISDDFYSRYERRSRTLMKIWNESISPSQHRPCKIRRTR